MNDKYINLIVSFEELLKDKDEVLLKNYDLSGLIRSLEKSEA